MTLFDIILIVLLGGFILYGLFFGLIHAAGGLVGVFAGVLLATRFFEPLGELAAPIFWGNENLAKIICFVILFILINRVVGFIFYLLGRAFDFLKIIPFLKSINSILGGILGFVEGAFLLGGILYVAARYPVIEFINKGMVDSSVARYLVVIFDYISPLLPQALRQLQALI
jgi:uncharacterized membrane protein required for colicin V production